MPKQNSPGYQAARTAKLIRRRVASANRANPERVQLVLKDDGDTYFRLYMFLDGELRNVAQRRTTGATTVSGRAR